MKVFQENLPLTMVRANLEGIPAYGLPPGFAICRYQAGDEQHWLEIQRLADRYTSVTPDLFRQAFGDDDKVLAERQFYLMDGEQPAIGTATAWYDDSFGGQPYGRVHWVAIMPQYQGQGLSKPLMTAVCRRLRELGHDRAYLKTSSARIPAIRLYLRFGFIPTIDGTGDISLWL